MINEASVVDLGAAPTVSPGALEPFDPANPELRNDPYPIYHRYRAADPIHWGISGLAGYRGAWYVFRYNDAISVLRDSRFGKARRQVKFAAMDKPEQPQATVPVPEAARPFFEMAKKWIVHRDPPEHTLLRNLLQMYFTPAAVAKLRPRITEITHALLDKIEAQGQMEAISDFAFPLPVNVISEMLGIPEEGRPLLSACSKHLQAVDLRTGEETWQQAGRAVATARQYIQDLVTERRRKPREDLMSRLIAARDGGASISEDEMLANILFLFVSGAGFETTTGLIGSSIHSLLRHPEERAKLLANPDLLTSAVDEFLRYESPVQVTNRTALEDMEWEGRQIRAGDSVLIVLAAANRDPDIFPNPDRLDISRKGKPHHAFGIGIHFCLGGALARVEGEVALEVLLRRMPKLQLAGKAEWNRAVSLRVLKSLPVTF